MNNTYTPRELSFLFLFRDPYEGNHSEADFNSYLEELKDECPLPSDKNQIALAKQITFGTLENKQNLDQIIEKKLVNWKLDRLNKVNHMLLLQAAYELVHITDTPYQVVLNETIELAKKYGTDQSSSFVNGVLDAIVKDRENAN